jgi:hypothetical protein
MCPIPKGFRDTAILVILLWRPVLSFPPTLLLEGKLLFWEVILSVILSQKLYMNMCPIPNGFRDRAVCLYSGLAWAPSIVGPSRLASPLSEVKRLYLRNRSQYDTCSYKVFCLEWPILWHCRILNLTPGTPCINILFIYCHCLPLHTQRTFKYTLAASKLPFPV